MAELGKVIKGLEKCLNPNLNCYHDDIDCPYESDCWLSDSLPTRPLKEDALELLKAQQEEIAELEVKCQKTTILLNHALEKERQQTQIVRCKDCKHGIGDENAFVCEYKIFTAGPDWYCADAERREEEE